MLIAALRRVGGSLTGCAVTPGTFRPVVGGLVGGLQAAAAARWMRVRSSIKKRCPDCYIVRRGKISYVYCTTHGRHKQRQGPKIKQS